MRALLIIVLLTGFTTSASAQTRSKNPKIQSLLKKNYRKPARPVRTAPTPAPAPKQVSLAQELRQEFGGITRYLHLGVVIGAAAALGGGDANLRGSASLWLQARRYLGQLSPANARFAFGMLRDLSRGRLDAQTVLRNRPHIVNAADAHMLLGALLGMSGLFGNMSYKDRQHMARAFENMTRRADWFDATQRRAINQLVRAMRRSSLDAASFDRSVKRLTTYNRY